MECVFELFVGLSDQVNIVYHQGCLQKWGSRATCGHCTGVVMRRDLTNGFVHSWWGRDHEIGFSTVTSLLSSNFVSKFNMLSSCCQRQSCNRFVIHRLTFLREVIWRCCTDFHPFSRVAALFESHGAFLGHSLFDSLIFFVENCDRGLRWQLNFFARFTRRE